MTDEELVAWVDEDEKLIKVIPKSLANSDPKYLHSEIVVLVVDAQRRVLLQQRAKTKPVHPGLWTVAAAGHVTYGDTFLATAHRELKEEMGIECKELIHLFREKVLLLNETHFFHWFLGLYQGDPIVIQTDEVDEYIWIGQSEYDDFSDTHKVSPYTNKVIQRYWAGEWDHLLK